MLNKHVGTAVEIASKVFGHSEMDGNVLDSNQTYKTNSNVPSGLSMFMEVKTLQRGWQQRCSRPVCPLPLSYTLVLESSVNLQERFVLGFWDYKVNVDGNYCTDDQEHNKAVLLEPILKKRNAKKQNIHDSAMTVFWRNTICSRYFLCFSIFWNKIDNKNHFIYCTVFSSGQMYKGNNMARSTLFLYTYHNEWEGNSYDEEAEPVDRESDHIGSRTCGLGKQLSG